MNRKTIVCLSLILFWSVTSVFGSTRTWTDDTGRFTVEAELEEVRGDSVVLRRVDGSQIVVPLARLSAADRDYLKGLSQAPKKPTPDRAPGDGDVPSDSAPPLAIAPFDAEEARAHQQAWAEHLGLEVEVENSVGMQLRLIPPGEFMMGSPESEEGRWDVEGPQHRVQITRPFYLGVYPVTQSQWESVMGTNPSWFSEGGKGSDLVSGLSTADFPVESVSWEDAQEFIGRLNERSEETGRVYRLPTAAEWEYACRAGTTTRYSFGDDEAELDEYGWYSGNTGGLRGGGRTYPVGQKRPNFWGLYDIHGNVFEWCSDWFSGDYYANSPLEDPTGPEAGSSRVSRGGGWDDTGWSCRSAYRDGYAPGDRRIYLGFRVAFSSVE